jgi:hypothetical protein
MSVIVNKRELIYAKFSKKAFPHAGLGYFTV